MLQLDCAKLTLSLLSVNNRATFKVCLPNIGDSFPLLHLDYTTQDLMWRQQYQTTQLPSWRPASQAVDYISYTVCRRKHLGFCVGSVKISYWCSSAICFCMSAVYWGPAGLMPMNWGWPRNWIPGVCMPRAMPPCQTGTTRKNNIRGWRRAKAMWY